MNGKLSNYARKEKRPRRRLKTILKPSARSAGADRLVHDYERAELVCQGCGLVIDGDFIDRGPEWRAFDHDQRMKRSRVGAPMTFTIHDKGLSTMIDWRNRDSYGRAISSKNRAQLYRLRKWQRRIRVSNATERNLAFALSELDRMASALGLPRNVRETAAVVYRDAVDKNLIRGRSIEGVAAAALYAACRQCNVPVPLMRLQKYPVYPEKRSAGLTGSSPGNSGSNFSRHPPLIMYHASAPGFHSRVKCKAGLLKSCVRQENVN